MLSDPVFVLFGVTLLTLIGQSLVLLSVRSVSGETPTRLEDGRIACRHCGAANDPEYRFCRHCIGELQSNSPAAPSHSLCGRWPLR